MGANESAPAPAVWPPDWNKLTEPQRKIARNAILKLSALPADEFMGFATHHAAIPLEHWRFEDYWDAAAAAVQEDMKLNKLIYKIVPRRAKEPEFWRLYFSQVLFVLDSVKAHGTNREARREAAPVVAAAPAWAAAPGAAPAVWPPDWNKLTEPQRKAARDAILKLSALPPAEFMGFAAHHAAIPLEHWRFEDYWDAAEAAVQEDIKLNRLIYKIVPRRAEEPEFWRLYFSQVLYALESVKAHGSYPPPAAPRARAPLPPAAAGPSTGSQAFRAGRAQKAPAPPPVEESACVVS